MGEHDHPILSRLQGHDVELGLGLGLVIVPALVSTASGLHAGHRLSLLVDHPKADLCSRIQLDVNMDRFRPRPD